MPIPASQGVVYSHTAGVWLPTPGTWVESIEVRCCPGPNPIDGPDQLVLRWVTQAGTWRLTIPITGEAHQTLVPAPGVVVRSVGVQVTPQMADRWTQRGPARLLPLPSRGGA